MSGSQPADVNEKSAVGGYVRPTSVPHSTEDPFCHEPDLGELDSVIAELAVTLRLLLDFSARATRWRDQLHRSSSATASLDSATAAPGAVVPIDAANR